MEIEFDYLRLAKESIVCGSFAGLIVDLSLYPLDTIKTRLQDKQRISSIRYKSSSLYSGLSSVLIGSAPSSALFFLTYNTTKSFFNSSSPFIHFSSAIIGEFSACIIRVPMEIVKQRLQVKTNDSISEILRSSYRSEGFLGLYRGYLATLTREIPFAIIQYPLWEYLKKYFINGNESRREQTFKGALAGSISGALAASLTTPLDVAKTRIMLSNFSDVDARSHSLTILKNLWRNEGFTSLYSGILPRTLWISIGGFVYFGAFQFASSFWISNNS